MESEAISPYAHNSNKLVIHLLQQITPSVDTKSQTALLGEDFLYTVDPEPFSSL